MAAILLFIKFVSGLIKLLKQTLIFRAAIKRGERLTI